MQIRSTMLFSRQMMAATEEHSLAQTKKGIEGLAMLLVDVDYDGKIFDMDRTVFAKDISDNGEIKISGMTESITVIAIDKHGNESKAFIA